MRLRRGVLRELRGARGWLSEAERRGGEMQHGRRWWAGIEGKRGYGRTCKLHLDCELEIEREQQLTRG
jgi:hypothetical protein